MSLAEVSPSPLVWESRQRVAENVRGWMARRNVTQTALAKRLGCSQPVISRRVRGEIPFDLDELIEIAVVLDIDLSELMDGARSRCFSLALVPPLDGQQGQLDLGLPPLSRADLQVVVP